MAAPEDRSRNPRWLAILIATGLGAIWISVEMADALLAGRAVLDGEALRSFAAALPWQLGFFALLGVPAAAARLGWRATGNAVLGAAVFVFFLSRVGEGILKDEGGTMLVALAWIGAAVALSVLPWLIGELRRVIPQRWRRGWVPAVWLAWIVAFTPALVRAAPTLGFARVPPLATVFDGLGLAFAFGSLAIVVAIAARPRLWPIAVLLFATPWLSRGLIEDAPAPREATRPFPNVIMVVIDTLRSDQLERTPDTPALDSFLSESIRFDRAISPGNHTLAAMPGVMTSLPAHSVGQSLSPDVQTLAEHLHDAGFTTVGISANPLISERTGYGPGFDHFSDSYDWHSYQVGDLRRIIGVLAPGMAYRTGIASSEFYYRPASEIRRRAIKVAAEGARPAFLYLQTMDMHGPYLPPRNLLEAGYSDRNFMSYFAFLRMDRKDVQKPDEELAAGIENMRQRYAGELRFTDRQLGLFFDSLREQGLWDESLIWLLSDHGESFGERGFSGHGGWNTTPSVQQVPLALKPPASWNLPPRAIDTPVSTFDVLPTTLALLGLPPPRLAAGTDLSNLIRGVPGERAIAVVSAAGGVRHRSLSCFDWPWQLDVRITPEGAIESRTLYNLAIDPDQELDLSRAHPRVVERLEKDLVEYIKLERRALVQTQQTQFDAQTLDQLRRLGYLE